MTYNLGVDRESLFKNDPEGQSWFLRSFGSKKGDGNDGEPDARRKLEFEKKAKIGWN